MPVNRPVGGGVVGRGGDGWLLAEGAMILVNEMQMSWKALCLSASKVPRPHKITMILPKDV